MNKKELNWHKNNIDIVLEEFEDLKHKDITEIGNKFGYHYAVANAIRFILDVIEKENGNNEK